MSFLVTKGNVEDVFKVLDNHNINSALILDNKLKVLDVIKEHLTFEDSGIEVVKDFINDKEETKYIIKVTSKDTGATIHIHLDTKEEFDLLKGEWKMPLMSEEIGTTRGYA